MLLPKPLSAPLYFVWTLIADIYQAMAGLEITSGNLRFHIVFIIIKIFRKVSICCPLNIDDEYSIRAAEGEEN